MHWAACVSWAAAALEGGSEDGSSGDSTETDGQTRGPAEQCWVGRGEVCVHSPAGLEAAGPGRMAVVCCAPEWPAARALPPRAPGEVYGHTGAREHSSQGWPGRHPPAHGGCEQDLGARASGWNHSNHGKAQCGEQRPAPRRTSPSPVKPPRAARGWGSSTWALQRPEGRVLSHRRLQLQVLAWS